MARYVAKYRPEVPILACGGDFVVFKLLTCIRGVIPFQCKDGDFDMNSLIEKAKELELIKGPCKIITLLEADQDNYDKTNEMKIVDVEWTLLLINAGSNETCDCQLRPTPLT